MRVTNAGRVGIGNSLGASIPLSMLNVSMGVSRFSVDEIGSSRPNNGRLIAGVAGGGACIGFNASRQADASFVCEPDGAFAPNGTTPNSRNGGALIWADVEGSLNFTALPSGHGTTGSAGSAQYYYPTDLIDYRVMKIKPTSMGQVQLGLNAPPAGTPHADYRLAVDGKLVAKAVFVTQAAANWADFVFEPTYALLPLPALESYLRENKHLPAIPAAAQVAREGIDLGTMQAKLLQTVEELTLHVIELGKQNARLQAEVTALAGEVARTPAPKARK